LDGDVEPCGRLVGDQKERVAGQRNRYHDSLSHPTRQLVWILPESLSSRRYAHTIQQLSRTVQCLPPT
jgi:hypothetical protein